MQDARDSASAEAPGAGPPRSGYRLVQPAPLQDEPVRRDRKGAQIGLTLALAVGAAFWAGVAALAIALQR